MKILSYVNSFFISVGLHSFIDHYRKIILSAYASKDDPAAWQPRGPV